MKILMLFLWLVLTTVATCQSPPANKAPTTVHALNASDSIGGWQQYLHGMDSVIAFHLNGNGHADSNSLEGFPILKRATLTSSQVMGFIAILKDSVNFSWDGYHKLCGFHPDLGFKFYQRDSALTVLLDNSCDVWKLFFNGQVQLLEADSAHAKIFQLASSVFPDQYGMSSPSPSRPQKGLQSKLILPYQMETGKWSTTHSLTSKLDHHAYPVATAF